jgi:hypothetical protein
VSREYGTGYFDILKMPLRTFWSFNRQVDRLRAEDEQRRLRLIIVGENPEAAIKLAETLRGEVGMPVIFERKFDDAMFDKLQQQAHGVKGNE